MCFLNLKSPVSDGITGRGDLRNLSVQFSLAQPVLLAHDAGAQLCWFLEMEKRAGVRAGCLEAQQPP